MGRETVEEEGWGSSPWRSMWTSVSFYGPGMEAVSFHVSGVTIEVSVFSRFH